LKNAAGTQDLATTPPSKQQLLQDTRLCFYQYVAFPCFYIYIWIFPRRFKTDKQEFSYLFAGDTHIRARTAENTNTRASKQLHFAGWICCCRRGLKMVYVQIRNRLTCNMANTALYLNQSLVNYLITLTLINHNYHTGFIYAPLGRHVFR